MYNNSKDFIKEIKKEEWAKSLPVQDDFWAHILDWFSEQLLPDFLEHISGAVNEIIEIDPDLSEMEILGLVAQRIVDSLDARFASARIYDPDTEQMLSFGSFPSGEKSRESYIPLENSIAGEVVKTNKSFLVPNIMEENLYLDKTIVQQRGVNSLMAIPLEIPRFFPQERDTAGVIQIYYTENDRSFTPLEVQVAELMSRRLSYVVARKKILSMYRVNEKKETIVQQIFQKLGSMEGIKMKDVFNRLIPELADIINLQSCALFSVSDDMDHVILEAGYPDSLERHGIGKSFPTSSEPAFQLILGLKDYKEESPYEIVTRSYISVMDPQKSGIVSKAVKNFAANHNINSILYIPLDAGEEITHFMTFDAIDYRKRYSSDEIDIFLFLGRELIKAHRMERLDDILHDFKNPAIATAGFARRLKQLLQKEGTLTEEEKIKKYVDILFEETSRLQEMALSISHVGKEQEVNLTEIVKRRFEINKEAIKEQLRQDIVLEEGPFLDQLRIRCFPLHMERIIDNILNNATKAIPIQGGTLSVSTYSDNDWACAEITNTGTFSERDQLRLLSGEVQGRGLYITHRIIRLLKGKMEIRAGKKTTTVLVRLPVYRGEGKG